MNVEVEHTRVGRGPVRVHELVPAIGRSKSLFMLAAGMSFLMSVYLFFTGSREQGIFVAIWVPSILAAGALLLGRNGRG